VAFNSWSAPLSIQWYHLHNQGESESWG
jgi:hypothetical protein